MKADIVIRGCKGSKARSFTSRAGLLASASGVYHRSMPGSTISVMRLPFEQIPGAARLLSRAFAEDPVLTYYLNDARRREVAYPAFFRASLSENWESGFVYGAHLGGKLVGVAVWAPPEGSVASAKFERRAKRNHAIVAAQFPQQIPAMQRGYEAIQKLHPQVPHWYLLFVGIDPSVQSEGIGSKLLAPVLRIADRRREICYLETPFPETHRFYGRQGFELKPPSYPFRGAAKVWTMVRPARTGG